MSGGRVSRALGAALSWAAAALCAGNPQAWVPARWEGGPLELQRRAADKALSPQLREAIAGWYDPATLALLEGTPINCLLVTFGAGDSPEMRRQQALVKDYGRAAHARGIAVLGLVRGPADAAALASAAAEAELDGLVADGFAKSVQAPGTSVIAIAESAAAARNARGAVAAVEGVRPSARDLADMGIRAGASAEPWLESNIWLVRSFRLDAAWRPVWVSQGCDGDYLRCVADAAASGGRWIVSPGDDLRAGLFRKDADALAAWRRMAIGLQFAEDHPEWRAWAPYGNIGIVLGDSDYADEYLNLAARRHVPYALVRRSAVDASGLAGLKAVLAATIEEPAAEERRALREFAENGGVVIAGPWWGGAPKEDPYAEITVGKGRAVVYRDPDPETVARDLLELLDPEVMGLSAFNVSSAIVYAATAESGRRVVIQMVNYADRPIARVTLRMNGHFQSARLYAPGCEPVSLAPRARGDGRTEVLVPKLDVWAAVVLE